MVPSASVPPSSGTPGLWRRKSGSGAVDAQGNLLVHPMVSCHLSSGVITNVCSCRLGSTSDSLAGVRVPLEVQAHGEGTRAQRPVEHPVPLLRTTRTMEITRMY